MLILWLFISLNISINIRTFITCATHNMLHHLQHLFGKPNICSVLWLWGKMTSKCSVICIIHSSFIISLFYSIKINTNESCEWGGTQSQGLKQVTAWLKIMIYKPYISQTRQTSIFTTLSIQTRLTPKYISFY